MLVLLASGLLRAAGTTNGGPDITRQPSNVAVPQGGNAVFSLDVRGNPPFSYQWFLFLGAVAGPFEVATTDVPVLTMTNVQPTQAGDYFVVVTNAVGTATSALAHLYVLTPPVILADPQSTNALRGNDVVLSVIATGAPPLVFRWFCNGTNLPGANGPNLFLGNVDSNRTGDYTAVVANGGGSVTSQVAHLEVLVPPKIITQPADHLVPAASDVSFSVAATGNPPPHYQWLRNSIPLTGETNANFLMFGVSSVDEGNYSVLVANAAGNVVSSNALLKILAPPLITVPPANLSLPAGGLAMFTVEAESAEPPQFQWQFNGTNLAGATNRVLFVPTVTSAQAGSYRVLVINAADAVPSQPANLQVFQQELAFSDNFDGQTVWPMPSFKGHGTNFTATRETAAGEPWHAGRRGFHSVWISWQAPASGIVKLNTAGSDFDTLLAVYTGDSLATLAPVENDDDDDAGQGAFNPLGWSKLQFNVVAGTIYRIAVDGADLNAGNIVLEGQFEATSNLLPTFLLPPHDGVVRQGQDWCAQVTPEGTTSQINWYFNGGWLALTGDPTTYCLPAVTEANVGIYQVELIGQSRTNRSRRFELQFNSSGYSNVMARDKLIEVADYMLAAGVQGGGSARLPKSGQRSAGGGTGTRGFTTTQIFTTAGATPEPGEPAHCGNGGPYHSKWFSYQAPTNGTLHITTEGSAFDTVLAVYIGPGTDFVTLTNIACNNNAGAASTWSEVTFAAVANRIYYIAVDGATSTATGVVHLTINLGDPVTFVTPPASQAVAVGANVDFSVDVHGSTNFNYTWRRNGLNLTNITNTVSSSSTLSLANVQLAQAGSYDVIVRNPINTATSTVATLVVLLAPSVILQPVSQAVMAGADASLIAAVIGGPTPAKQWFFNGAPLVGQTNPVLNFVNFQLANQGSYHLLATNLAGSVTTDEVELWLVNTQSLFVKFAATNGAFRLRAACPTSGNHVIEASTNLTTWAALSTNAAPFGILNFLDTSATNFPWRFYRARPE